MSRSRMPGLIDADAGRYKNKYSLYYDGTQNRVECGNWHVEAPFSVMVWAKCDENPLLSNRSLIGKYKYNTDDRCWELHLDTSNPTRMYMYTSSGGTFSPENQYCAAYNGSVFNYEYNLQMAAADTWVCYGIAMQASGIVVGAAGKEKQPLTFFSDVPRTYQTYIDPPGWHGYPGNSFYNSPVAQVSIGGHPSLYYWFGHIAEAAIWSGVALSPAEFSSIVAASGQADLLGSFGDYDRGANLEGWWKMGDGAENGAGTTVYDCSGKGHHGTMVGLTAADYTEEHP